MKKLKKVFAVLLSVAMILGMSTTVFAAEATAPTDTNTPQSYPSDGDAATVQVGGLKAGDVVSFYRVVKPTYKQHGVKGYETIAIGDKVVSNVESPSSESVTNVANAILTTKPTASGTATANDSGVATSGLMPIGMYIALVTPGNGNVDTAYNPMVVSSFYTKNGIRTEVVSANETFDLGTLPAYAKHTAIDIDKQIVNSSGKLIDGTTTSNKGDDTAIGEDTTFKITTQFPAYSAAYKQVEFNIIDTLSKGLTAKPETIVIKLKGADGNLTKGENADYTVDEPVKNPDTGVTTMTIRFNSKCILDNAGAEIEMQYDATLNKDAGINFDKNTNTVKAEYSNHPTNNTKATTDEKKTYHYTFGIDAKIGGSLEEEWNQKTTELYKVGQKETEENGTIEHPYTALNGAKFELRLRGTDTAVAEAMSGHIKDADGNWTTEGATPGALEMIGLDAGEYDLVEIEPPQGYQLNDTVVPVDIVAHYNEDGTLHDYTITINKENTTTYTANYNADKLLTSKPTVTKDLKSFVQTENGTLVNPETGLDPEGNMVSIDGSTFAFMNTDLASLPSTGGIGTIIFTVGGCLIMVVAAALYFANRRRSANSESK